MAPAVTRSCTGVIAPTSALLAACHLVVIEVDSSSPDSFQPVLMLPDLSNTTRAVTGPPSGAISADTVLSASVPHEPLEPGSPPDNSCLIFYQVEGDRRIGVVRGRDLVRDVRLVSF